MKYLLILLVSLSLNVKAQNTDSLSQSKVLRNISNPRKFHSYIIPTVFVSYGLLSLGDNVIRGLDLSTKSELSEDHPRFAAHVDEYAIFSPLAAMYVLDIAGIKGKSTVADQTAMVLITTAITTISITALKNTTHRLRPDGSSDNSFPSGHTATVFAAAEMFNQEFKDQSSWFGYAGYAVASATGILRMYNNKHWLSDVIAGAGFGILSTKLTYIIYPYLKKALSGNKNNFTLAPIYESNKIGFKFSLHI